MQLSELEFERRSQYSERAKLLLGGGYRLYVYRYRRAPEEELDDKFFIYLNHGSKSGAAAKDWEAVEPLVAQCVLMDTVNTYGVRGEDELKRWWDALRAWWHRK